SSDLAAAGHCLGRQLRHQVAQVGVTGNHNESGFDPALWGVYHGVGPTIDAHCRTLLINNAAEAFYGCGFAESQVQRVDMAAAHVEHAADVVFGLDHFTDALGIHDLQL